MVVQRKEGYLVHFSRMLTFGGVSFFILFVDAVWLKNGSYILLALGDQQKFFYTSMTVFV